MDLSKITAVFSESVIREMTRVAINHQGCLKLAQGYHYIPAP